MDKLIKVPKSKRADEVSLSRKIKTESKPLLDIEDRLHNYDDRRSYTSYAEITKDFEDDFRCQDDVDYDDNNVEEGSEPPVLAPCRNGNAINIGSGRVLGAMGDNLQMLEERLLIGKNDSSGRQRKLPIVQEAAAAAVAAIPHANALEMCATARREARSAAVPATASRTGVVRRIEETGTAITAADDEEDDDDCDGVVGVRVKSSKTLQESIRESLTINNTATWNNSEDQLIERYHHNTNHLIFEMNEFYIHMLDQLATMRRDFQGPRSKHTDLVDPHITEEFTEWTMTDQYDVIKSKSETTAETNKYNSNILRQFEICERLDREIEVADSKWKDMKRERLEIQNSLCQEMEQGSNADLQKSQVFLELCQSEVDTEENAPVLENNEVKEHEEKRKCKSAVYSKKNFVKRNVDIAKNMSFPVSLTDEEKLKLNAILTEEDDNTQNDEASADKDDKDDTESYELKELDEEIDMNQLGVQLKNEYKLEVNDWDRMSEINEKIKSLSNLNENKLDINDVECQLEVDAKLGKNWKYSLLDERLKEIDEQLASIIQEKETEVDIVSVRDGMVADINQSSIILDSIELAL